MGVVGVGVGCQGCSEAGGVEVRGGRGGLVDYAKVGEVGEDAVLVGVQVGFCVCLAEFEGGD